MLRSPRAWGQQQVVCGVAWTYLKHESHSGNNAPKIEIPSLCGRSSWRLHAAISKRRPLRTLLQLPHNTGRNKLQRASASLANPARTDVFGVDSNNEGDTLSYCDSHKQYPNVVVIIDTGELQLCHSNSGTLLIPALLNDPIQGAWTHIASKRHTCPHLHSTALSQCRTWEAQPVSADLRTRNQTRSSTGILTGKHVINQTRTPQGHHHLRF